jgi:hypothetical protein
MTDSKIEKLLQKLAEKLRSKQIPDDFTGKIILNLQTGGLSGQVEVETKV